MPHGASFRYLFRHNIIVFALILFFSCGCSGSSGNQDAGPAYVMSFETGLDNNTYPGVLTKISGGQIIPDGISGKALRLSSGEFLTLDTAKLFNPAEGIIAFWVRPHWDDNDVASHTFLSFTWLDGREGYFAFTRGWWEPDGTGVTYFVGNNYESNTARKIRYEKGVWTHLTCAWQAGSPGLIRLYVNGILASESKPFTGAFQPKKELFLGSDNGALFGRDKPLPNGRWADADFDEITFSRRNLSDAEILDLYERRVPVRHTPKVNSDGIVLETRAIFDEGLHWITESGARNAIQRIKKAGFNVFVPCVWHGSGTSYPSSVAPPVQWYTLDPDPLKRLITIAHENGIQVHPWFTVMLRDREFLTDYYGVETPQNAFDVHRPDFRNFIVNTIVDVAQRYDIDGVNLDFIRTMGTCNCNFCVQEYQNIYSRSLVDDAAHPNADGTLEPHLQVWQDTAVEAIVREVSLRVKELRPHCIVSVDGYPQPYPNDQGRQEPRWTNAGLVDLVFSMDYAQPVDVEHHHLMLAQFNESWKMIMLIANYNGISDNNQVSKPPEQLITTMDYIRMRWGNGMGVYLYSMLDDRQIEAIKKGPFASDAQPSFERPLQ